MNPTQKAFLIKQRRVETIKQDTPELQKRREKFVNWLLVRNPELRVQELYKGEDYNLEGKEKTPQYFKDYFLANTRNQTKTELGLDMDKLNFEKMMKVFCEICLELVRRNYHFAVFHSKGQRSPHIRIYDLKELETLNSFQREKARAMFWRAIVPFFFHHIDPAMFNDDQPVVLEFSIHHRTKLPFNLLFEYVPTITS